MNKNHISDELLIACIGKSLSKTAYNNVTKHLENCDKCYLRYSILIESASESESTKPEEVPNDIKQFAKEQLGLIDTISPARLRKNTIFNKFKNIGRNISILRPIPVATIIISIALLLVFLNNPNLFTKSTPFIATSEEINPVSMKIENDSLIISQSIKVNNLVSIYSINGDTLFTNNFSGRKWILSLDRFKDNNILQILISSQGMVLIDSTVILP